MTSRSPFASPSLPRIAALVALAAALGCRAADLPGPVVAAADLKSPAHGDELTLGPGDVVRVGVWGHPELSTPLLAAPYGTRIDPQGMLSLPLVGPVAVADKSVGEAREAIAAALATYVQGPRVDVSVVEYASRRFYLYGEVQKPGAQVLDRPLNVYQALSLGGGFTPRADRARIVLLRGTPPDLQVCVFDGESPRVDGLVAIRPDDFLFVRRTGAGRFSDEALPILTGISSSLAAVATLLLIDRQID